MATMPETGWVKLRGKNAIEVSHLVTDTWPSEPSVCLPWSILAQNWIQDPAKSKWGTLMGNMNILLLGQMSTAYNKIHFKRWKIYSIKFMLSWGKTSKLTGTDKTHNYMYRELAFDRSQEGNMKQHDHVLLVFHPWHNSWNIISIFGLLRE